MIRTLALAAAIAADTGDTWLGQDKVKHFLVSAFVQSMTYSAARVATDRRPAQIVAGGFVVTLGVVKEARDRRAGRVFSVRDLVWGMAGAVAAASILNGTR